MTPDALPNPGLVRNGSRLRNLVADAISDVETLAPSVSGGRPSQARALDSFLGAARTALSSFIDSTAPTFASAAIAAGTPNLLTVTFSEQLNATVVPAASAFVSSPARTFTNVQVSGNTVILTASAPFVAGATTIAYTQPAVNRLQDGSGNVVATFGAQSVTNGVA